MPRESTAYLYDISSSIEVIESYCKDKSFTDYQTNRMLRSAVERELSIIGEAMTQLRNQNTELLSTLSHNKRIIGFRNILIHAYTSLDAARVWEVTQLYLH